MTASPWDDPEINSSGDYYAFDNVGDVASGVITFVGTHRYDDGKLVPSLQITDDDGTDKVLNAGQVRLKAELVEQRPSAGDHLRVTLSNIEKRAGGKTLKHFTVQVTRGHAPHLAQGVAQAAVAAPVAAPVAEAAPGPVIPDPAAAAAAMANLTAEQRQALGLPPA